ncbi:aluminum-activated malate transporter 9 [Zea mays]|uniref:Aluminum-activated malate transporter 9 n=1 Tax=Zea mays TaxID=4577 RepID=A0A1D6HJ81_MAIZE|nr:aluminum-activated malate transporter 9 [Zea mays]AQK74539.1 Aluminum-activated malate transporter 9 [Zea mays]
MGALPAGLPPLPPHLGTLRSTPDQRGAQEPLLGLDWSVADGDGGAGEQAAWGVGDGSARGVVGRLRRAARAVRSLVVEMWEFARKDPRKPVFAAKVAVALALITLLVFLREPSDIASHSVWAILTVVVVFEFSIGATLSKGFNRGLGTLIAGGLALLVAELAAQMGKYDMLVLIISTFVVAFCATLTKLHPKMKPYEYGFRVFLLTFCYVTVSGYNTGEFTATAISRFVLIALGAAVSLGINICIHPIWAGEDLHLLVARNFSGVAKSLEGCVDGYLACMEYERVPSKILTYEASDDDPVYSGYRAAVEASAQEETLLGFAIWEPPHGPYKMVKYPWKNYTKVGGALRHCSFSVMALHGCILSEIQAPPESRKVFCAELHRVGQEGAEVLRELGQRVKTMTKLSSPNILSEVHLAAEELQKKIDEKSYLLVNTERTHDGASAPDKDESPENAAADSVHTSTSFASNLYLSRYDSSNPFLGRYDSGSTAGGLYKAQSSWPARQSFHPSLPFEIEESRIYESASALSLATFASLLIEFVARLQNLVDAFEELSDKANFKDPVEEPSTISRETPGVLARIHNFFLVQVTRMVKKPPRN